MSISYWRQWAMFKKVQCFKSGVSSLERLTQHGLSNLFLLVLYSSNLNLLSIEIELAFCYIYVKLCEYREKRWGVWFRWLVKLHFFMKSSCNSYFRVTWTTLYFYFILSVSLTHEEAYFENAKHIYFLVYVDRLYCSRSF